MEVHVLIHRAVTEFLNVQSEAAPAGVAFDWVIDWRWLCEGPEEATLTSERSLIECPTWARPKTPRHG